jgi:hypothetical protein
MYLDGTRIATATSSVNFAAGNALTIASDQTFSGRYFNGFIDDIRITKGSARGYTGTTITVPTAAFPDAGPVGVPTSVSASGGNTQVSLSWTAPVYTGGSSITDYSIQYSSDSGTTWTSFSHSASTSTTATITGLTNGTAYVFRVAAVNGSGTGSYTAATSSVTPSNSLISLRNDLAESGTFVGGLGTFTSGSGTLSQPFVRSANKIIGSADGMSHYRFYASANCTIYVTFTFVDDDNNSNSGFITKNGSSVGSFVGNGVTATRSVSLVNGDYVSISSNDPGYTSVEGVSVYAA